MMANRILPLEIRGFSRGNAELLRPLPEKPEEDLPSTYVQTVRDALGSLYLSEGGESGLSTPVNETYRTDASDSSFPSESSHDWSTTTGTLTGRSSVYSWANDNEFDRKAATSVQRMFEEIENMLYEGKQFDGGHLLMAECEEWYHRFPHLRIRGIQLLPSQESGTEVVALDDDDPRVYNNRPHTTIVDMEMEDCAAYQQDFQELAVQGTKAQIFYQEDDILQPEVVEEIFAQDGCVEEFYACDECLSSDDFKKQRLSNRQQRHSGFPPITPSAVATDTILSEMFDQIWGEIVLWLRGLLTHYLENYHPVHSEKQSDFLKESTAIDTRQISHDNCRLKCGIQSDDLGSLNNLMTIRSLPLQQRTTVCEGRENTPLCQIRPGSSGVIMSKHQRILHWRNSEQTLNSRLSSARILRRNPSIRLQPIDRSKTPAIQIENDVICEGVRGTKLVPGNDYLSLPTSTSPQLWGSRNGTLPPIDKTEGLDNSSRENGKSKVHFCLRAASAALNESRKSMKEKGSLIKDSRPNTTHSFRPPDGSSTRRYSTPLGSITARNNQLRPAGSFGYTGQSMMTGITGVSMPISNSHPSTDHVVHGHSHKQNNCLKDDDLAGETDNFDDSLMCGHHQPSGPINNRKIRHTSSIR